MKKLLLAFSICIITISVYSQDVSSIDISDYKKGVNVSVITGFSKESAFDKIIKLIKSKGLELDVINKDYGIITTKPRGMKNDIDFSYSLKVYLEDNEIRVRVFSILANDKGYDLSVKGWNQGRNAGAYRDGFRHLAYWTNNIASALEGDVRYEEEE